MTTEVRATIADLRAAKICARSARVWFVNHDMDWNEFVAKGLPAQPFRDTGDPFAGRLAEKAEERTAREKSGG